jgi:hypothetical protein
MADLSSQKLPHVLHDDRAGGKLPYCLGDNVDEQIATIEAADIRVVASSSRTLRGTHPLTRWAGSEQGRRLIPFASIGSNDISERFPEVTRNPYSPWMVEERNMQTALLQLGHHLELEPSAGEADIAGAAVAEQAHSMQRSAVLAHSGSASSACASA